jgi:serine/tyrosine/threonine adenylyltransferase
MAPISLAEIAWDDLFVRSMPGDHSGRSGSRQVVAALYATTAPTPVAAPRLLAWSDEAAALLGLASPPRSGDLFNDRHATELAAILSGNRLLPGMRPFAAGYGGHQFGTWAGQLGDGRALTLGEHVGGDGRRWELQLKGAGPTPYSRRSDGRAVLRSSIREFLCSEAMHHLGVPTTRALSLVATGDEVVRDMFYDGRPRAEAGAIVCRVAPTFVRFGSFELLAWRQDEPLLRRLVAFVLRHHFAELFDGGGAAGAAGPVGADQLDRDAAAVTPAIVAAWFAEICRRTAVMIAHWMRVGFVHGVMNTDNMSILGLTIDYGPYGWIEPFDPDFTPNTTDAATGRYRFGMQPGIAQWNLAHLARALAPLCPSPADKEALAAGLDVYRATFERTYGEMMRQKLGLSALPQERDDELLINDLLTLLAAEETDYTWFFRGLATVSAAAASDAASAPGGAARGPSDDELVAMIAPALYAPPAAGHRANLIAWLRRYLPRAAREPGDAAARAQAMAAVNPVFLLRNYLVQQAIDRAERGAAATGQLDASGIEPLLAAARSPYREGPEHQGLLDKRPEWARDAPGCSALSCSS